MQALISTLKALTDETRLRIMNILLERECCVCEVMQALDISQTRASRNLGILQKTGFLKTRREGQWILYSINQGTDNQYIISLLRLLEESPVNRKQFGKDKERLQDARRIGPKCVKKGKRQQI
jgi:ArsR family transcriptional regulator